jgi:hypothetical protein
MKRRNSPNRTLWRKSVQPQKSVGEWSRMLHLSWMRDIVDKINFKKNKDKLEG